MPVRSRRFLPYGGVLHPSPELYVAANQGLRADCRSTSKRLLAGCCKSDSEIQAQTGRCSSALIRREAQIRANCVVDAPRYSSVVVELLCPSRRYVAGCWQVL